MYNIINKMTNDIIHKYMKQLYNNINQWMKQTQPHNKIAQNNIKQLQYIIN